MASFGQTLVQALQSTQRPEMEAFFSAPMEMACSGHVSTHKPQPMQVSQSTIMELPSRHALSADFADYADYEKINTKNAAGNLRHSEFFGISSVFI
jgi:hypothetical protein